MLTSSRVERGRHRALGILLAATTAAVLAAAPLASAAPAPPTPPVPPTPSAPSHPQDDHMGSTIRAHELTTPSTLSPHAVAAGQTSGMDVSSHQGNVNWPAAFANGARFAYVKATESTTYTNPYFGQQYDGSYNAGMIRGAYHFADPDLSSGATQATYFVNHGGRWSADGRTLPPMLDIEYDPYSSNICYGLTPGQMSAWIADFSNTVHALTSRYPTIYSTTNWWNTCTGSNGGFGANPLFIARYNTSPGTLPPGWSSWTFWQYSDSGVFPGDQDVFQGSTAQLQAFAGPPPPPDPIVAYYNSLGGARSYLGAPVGSEYAVAGGSGQNYAGGTIYYSSATGAHAMHGTILARYTALGGPGSRLGFPTSDEIVANDNQGRYETFAKAASIYWNPAINAAFALVGPARDKYVALGGPAGFLGYPSTDTTTCPDGVGTFTHFTGAGGSVYYSPTTTAHEVHGAIAARWAQLGWERSALGYPTSDEQAITGGRRSTFQHGAISWNAATGATSVTTS